MRLYIKEIIVMVLQLFMFYVFPLFAGPTDAIGMVVMIILATFLFSIVLGLISDKKMKYVYPVITAIVFVPSVFIYYNETAMIHSMWYLVVSSVGMIIGSVLRQLIFRKSKC